MTPAGTGQCSPTTTSGPPDWRGGWRHALRLLVLIVLASAALSLCLELLGWQILRATTSPPPSTVPIGQLLHGAGQTLLGAMTLGGVLAAGSLLLPQTRRNAWHRVPLAFALGSGAFLCFLSVVSLGFFR